MHCWDSLTRAQLRKNANIGIFSKGKASSPIKHRDGKQLAYCETVVIIALTLPIVPEHAFSETHFLSRKTPRNRRESVTIDVNELKDRGQKERTPYDFAPPRAERSVGPPQMMHKDKSPQRMAESDSVPHPLPHARTSGPDARHEEDEAQSVAQPLLPQGGTSKLESGSATPYSWSESESSITRLERAVDLRLLEILHTGLSSTQISNAEKSKHSQRDYCDLQGLKALLNDRKAHWETKDRLSNSSCFREKLVEASAPSERAADIQPSLTSGVISSGEPGLLLNQSPPDPQFPRPRDCDDHGRTVTINRPDQIGQLSQHHDEMDMMEIEENDEAFFHKLDAAFHEIMGPECKAIEPIRGRQRGKRTSLHRKSMPSLLSDQVGSEIPPLVPSPIIWQSTEKLATRSAGHHESREFVNRSSNEGCPEQNVEDQYLAGLLKQPLSGSTQPAGYGARTVPKGFWRQNKLC